MGMLDSKVALITGAARGQGRAHALTSAREGADVVLIDAPRELAGPDYPLGTAEELQAVGQEVKELGRQAIVVPGDVRDQDTLDDAVSQAISTFGHLDIVMANAGLIHRKSFWEITDQEWSDMVDTTLTGVWRTVKAATPHMIERGTGSVVITSSINGVDVPGPNYAHYTAAKYGAVGLMKSIALELAPHGIRANAICPGGVNTGMSNNPAQWERFGKHLGGSGTEEEFLEVMKGTTRVAGLGYLEPQSMADAGLFLNSHLAAAITGVALVVDGGKILQ